MLLNKKRSPLIEILISAKDAIEMHTGDAPNSLMMTPNLHKVLCEELKSSRLAVFYGMTVAVYASESESGFLISFNSNA